jgi:hypothetical protein
MSKIVTVSLIYRHKHILTRATRRNNPEDNILHSHRRENLKSYIYKLLIRNTHISYHY